jgi:ESS family glutamate:Na+ symporter
MAAGHCGVGLGQTPNAIANMASVIERNGPAPNAWFVLPVITVVFINLLNPVVITLFMNLLAPG